jgi:phosphoenolpyruvate synthase/pyruvate phosphate dikinase
MRMKQFVESIENDVPPLEGLPKNLVRLGGLVRELLFWKSERIDAFALGDHYMLPIYKTVADLLELPLDLIFCMTRDELTQAIIGKRDVEIETLKQRADKYCIAMIDGKIGFYQTGSLNKQKKCDIAGNGDVLQGMTASPGVVRGRVKILSLTGENPVLSTDDIIVTSMTRPELGAALDVALAYVTDEGGRLCHAAIVSREKNKPCVIGLGNATKVLRTGMLIEVDGSAGTVTIIDNTVT